MLFAQYTTFTRIWKTNMFLKFEINKTTVGAHRMNSVDVDMAHSLMPNNKVLLEF